MNIVDTHPAPDWWQAAQVAQGLGVGTRRLVALHETEQAIDWCLSMAHQNIGVSALSYYELATLLGWRGPDGAAGATLEWAELLQSVTKLQAAVKVKADEERKAAEEKRAAAEAAVVARAAAEREAAEKAAAEEAERLADEDLLAELAEGEDEAATDAA